MVAGGELERRDDSVVDRALYEIVRLAIEGVGPFKGAADLVEPLRRKGMTTSAIVTRLIRTQCTQATAQGAVAGLGGLVTATVGLVPAAAAAVFVQARLVAAIAHSHGHDLDDPAVRNRIIQLVTGASAATGAKKVGMEMGERAARSVAPRLQARAASRVASRVAAGRSAGTIATRVASGGVGRAVPVVGAVVGGAVDLAVTRRIAERARREFGTA
jgi:hypothetical protein